MERPSLTLVPKPRIIKRDRSIIISLDLLLDRSEEVVEKTQDIDEVGAYKIPAISGLEGWISWVDTLRICTNKPLIYDHQKAGTDVPDTAEKFMESLSAAEFDAVILSPRTNDYETQEAWIKAAQKQELGVIVGGEMTHMENPAHYVEILDIYSDAVYLGVTDFVVPGNKPESIKRIREIVESKVKNPTFYAPGFGEAQGGDLAESAKVAGERFHAIVGRGIYWNTEEDRYNNADEMRKATLNLVKNFDKI